MFSSVYSVCYCFIYFPYTMSTYIIVGSVMFAVYNCELYWVSYGHRSGLLLLVIWLFIGSLTDVSFTGVFLLPVVLGTPFICAC